MNREIRIILLDKADKTYSDLISITEMQTKEGLVNTSEIQLMNSIKQKIEFIRRDPFYGDNIPKRLIPRSYDVQNLWRVELVKFWRMLYTIKGDKIEIICFVLDILDHKRYNKIFKYRKN